MLHSEFSASLSSQNRPIVNVCGGLRCYTLQTQRGFETDKSPIIGRPGWWWPLHTIASNCPSDHIALYALWEFFICYPHVNVLEARYRFLARYHMGLSGFSRSFFRLAFWQKANSTFRSLSRMSLFLWLKATAFYLFTRNFSVSTRRYRQIFPFFYPPTNVRWSIFDCHLSTLLSFLKWKS